MISIFSIFSGVVIFLGTINLVRMALFMIGSDWYGLLKHFSRKKSGTYEPQVSVIIPAFNEEKSVIAAIRSVQENTYPKDKLEIIVVNDGSRDNTEHIVTEYISMTGSKNVQYVYQSNEGKAAALNNGIKNYASGELIMCLDADSRIHKNAIAKAVAYFTNPSIAAIASNVKIVNEASLLNLIQQYEYLVAYQMKKALTVFNIEYIIGGIGSCFRKNAMKEVEFYDCNTVTEDIDITMKLLRRGNRKTRVVYADDVIAYTPSALTVADLLKQRFRWKWGRMQTFYKNKRMFFAWDSKYTKRLSWIYLPFALFSEASFILEPFMIGFILYVVFAFNDFATLLSAILITSYYLGMNILSEETIASRRKVVFIALAPLMYFCFYVLSFVEYFALIKSLGNLPKLKSSLLTSRASWLPIARPNHS